MDQTLKSSQELNSKTQNAYRLYSQFYAIISLLAYWIVWRGKIFKHISFFRDLLKTGHEILDIATGDGSLTKVSLFYKKSPLQKIICLDLSNEMLNKAKSKINDRRAEFILGDVMNLPFADQSWQTLACFGGFNSFPSGELALKEIKRIMKPGAALRGSVLLMPRSPWRQRLVLKWIREGYQTEIVTPDIFDFWVKQSGLHFNQRQQFGDVLLFELVHPS